MGVMCGVREVAGKSATEGVMTSVVESGKTWVLFLEICLARKSVRFISSSLSRLG